MRGLVLIFIVVPILEMWVLIEVGSQIGALATIGLVFLTAIIGLALLKRQGLATLAKAQGRMQSGELPAKELVDAVFLAVGGALLLTPGFVTDIVGFSCLIPGLRSILVHWIFKNLRFNLRYQAQAQMRRGDSFNKPHQEPTNAQANTIEGEFRREK